MIRAKSMNFPIYLLILIYVLVADVSAWAGTSVCHQDLGNLPLCFIENEGQIDSSAVAFYVKGADKVLYFTSEGVTFALSGRDEDAPARWTARLSFDDAISGVAPAGADRTETMFNYFKGAPDDWKTGIAAYSQLIYEDLWPGIDLVFSGTVDELKYEFIVEPGVDPGTIGLSYQGITGLCVRESGALEITTPLGSFEDGIPYAYQMVEGDRKAVDLSYALGDENGGDVHTYGFRLGPFDRSKTLIVDPSLLVYCGYIGGNYDENGRRIAVDSQGCAYVTGEVCSDELSFPVSVGPDLSFNGLEDAFVAKVNPEGTDLVFCGYIGGDSSDIGKGIALDAQDNVYLIGQTHSDESTFPVVAGPDLTFNGGYHKYDTFVAKLNAQGTTLIYCGYIGGTGKDRGEGIVVDTAGNAYVSGYTDSDESSFPVSIGPDLTYNGGYGDAYVAKVNVQGTGLDFAGYIGGSGWDQAHGIALDGQGAIYITGDTSSDESSFPVVVGPDLTFNDTSADYDCYVAKVNPQGTSLDYCGYIGGADGDAASDIAVNSQGIAVVGGCTRSDETSFPVVTGPDLTFNGYIDLFVAAVNAQGTGLDFCGFIGGTMYDGCRGIAMDNEGRVFVTGTTESDETSFPTTVGPDLTYNGGTWDIFVAMVNSQGTDLAYCGYIGGSDRDLSEAIAVDTEGNSYTTGSTQSDETSFPVVVGPDLTHNSAYVTDAFVAKVPAFHVLLRAGNVNSGSDNPADVLYINGSAGDDAHRTITNPPGTPVTMGMLAPPGGPDPAAFVLYVWPGEAGPTHPAEQPFDIGTACFPMPLSNGNPSAPPTTLVNNVGYPGILGTPLLPGVYPAPTYIIKSVILPQGTWTLQGIIIDSNSSGAPASLTNAIVFVQQ